MKYYKNLSIKGAVLDKDALGKYIEKVAENHNIVSTTNKKTYPIYDLKENYKFILKTYELLNEHLLLGISIHSAGEWLLDNFYLIEETVKNIEKEISVKRYERLNAIGEGRYKGYARIYVLASEIIGYTDSKVDSENIKYAIDSYQFKKLLTTEELILLPIFLQISIIQNIAEVCEKIYVAQIQKYKVEDICARIIDNKEEIEYKKNRFKINVKNKFDYSDLKNSFVEYMAYKLKRKGSKGSLYLEILNEQVNYTGTTVDEIIKKEHFHIATIKNSIGNAITSIKNINRMNFKELFANINKVEELLNKDPAGVFYNMTVDTKDMYMNVITELSQKAKISEIFIATEVLKLASRYKSEKEYTNRKSHVGYYLIDKGKNELCSILYGKRVRKLNEKEKSVIYVRSTFYIPIIISLIIIYLLKMNFICSIISFLVLLFPISEVYIKTITYVISRIIKPKKIPKMNLENKISKECATFVVIPTILDSKSKIDELIKKIEVYYLANKSENLYFGILGDCISSNKENEEIDKEIIEYGREKIKELNDKYKNKGVFNFLYRKRKWNASEKQFLGWERKRGLLNQFNDYLLYRNDSDFIVNTLKDINFSEKIKYIITLDSDTNLVLNSVFSMVGAMTHILNVPVIRRGKVISGYGIMQPKIGISLKDSVRSTFSRIYSGTPGTNLYSSATSDFYQDIFGEGIFTGKGIYDLEIYDEILKDEIKENEVLSHDLLEGNYLRCGLLTDTILLDKYPYKFTSYLLREHRWIRGDWQLLKWLKRDKEKINLISKYKIYDNLRRSILPITQFILFFISLITENAYLMIINLVSVFISIIYSIIDKVIFKRTQTFEIINAYKNFSIDFSGIKGEFIKVCLNFAFLPTYAYMSGNAIVKTLYRMRKKEKLLEWITSDEVEKIEDGSIEKYYKNMFLNLISGIILFGFLNPFGEVIGTLWIIAPFISWYISMDNYKLEVKNEIISEDDKNYLLDIGKMTWKYFYDYINEDTNFLPPDNYQLGRKEKIVYRTSSTNIGLGLLSIISAYDLKYISLDESIHLIQNTLEKIDVLEKWNGHLYNWYNIKKLKPLYPRYVSSVDSGNFVGYMYTLKGFLKEIEKRRRI